MCAGQHDTKLFTKTAVPDATGYPGSFTSHQHVGLCTDPDIAHRMGPVWARDGFCACSSCRPPTYDLTNCKLKPEVGLAKRKNTEVGVAHEAVALPCLTHLPWCMQLKEPVAGRTTQTAALEQFAETLGAKQIVAVNVDEADRFTGKTPQRYWLALLLGEPFTLPESMVHTASLFEAGWLVVEAQWCDLVQVSHRGYALLPGKVLLLVNTIVRVDGSIKFDKPKAAQPKKGAKKVNLLLSEGEHNRVENCTNV